MRSCSPSSAHARPGNFPVPQPQHVTINGMPAAVTTARVNTDSGPIDASVAAYQWDARRVYYFIMLTPGGYGVGPSSR